MDEKLEPYVWTWIDDDGIRRQAKVHATVDGRGVVWDPRFVGDPRPWFDANTEDWRCGDEYLATLGMPVTAWTGFDY